MSDCSIEGFWKRLFFQLSGKESLKQFCGRLGFSYQSLTNQKCQGRYPSIQFIMQASNDLGVSVDWLLFGKNRIVNLDNPESLRFKLKKEITKQVLSSDSEELLKALQVILNKNK